MNLQHIHSSAATPDSARRNYLLGLLASVTALASREGQAQGLLGGLPGTGPTPDAVQNWAALSARFSEQGPPVQSKRVGILVAEYAPKGSLEIGIECPQDGVELLALFARTQTSFAAEKLQSADVALALFTLSPRLVPRAYTVHAFTATTRYFGVAVVNGAVWTAEKEVKLLASSKPLAQRTAA
jgi:hypothetical protein